MEGDLMVTRCVSAAETQQAYADLVNSKLCGDGRPCMRDDCRYCGPVNRLIDLRGDQCEARGCTLAKCIYDGGDLTGV